MHGAEVMRMTSEQKQQIQLLRAQGLSFTQIAHAAGLSRNSVKSYCQREAKKQDAEPKSQCKNCNTLIAQTTKQKPRQYCNDTCRYAYWNRQRRGGPA